MGPFGEALQCNLEAFAGAIAIGAFFHLPELATRGIARGAANRSDSYPTARERTISRASTSMA